MLKYLSFKKNVNFLKVYFGYFISILLKKPFVFGYPSSLAIEPTNRCNLKCLECPTGNNTSNREKGDIAFGLYKSIINELSDYLIYHMLYFQGEPFLNPDIFKMIMYADKRKIFTSISTNGHFLSEVNNSKIIESGLKKIYVSIDGTTQDSYEKYRIGGDIKKVIEGVKDLVLRKKTTQSKYPIIVVQFLVLKTNEHQISEIKKLSKNIGVDKLELKSAQIENFSNNLLPDIQEFSRYDKLEGSKFKIKNNFKNRCFRIWSTILISWEGKVIPCCFDKRLQYNLGLAGNGVINSWRGMQFKSFRGNVLLNRKKVEICCNCTEGLKLKN